jgi:hypothetical protein
MHIIANQVRHYCPLGGGGYLKSFYQTDSALDTISKFLAVLPRHRAQGN